MPSRSGAAHRSRAGAAAALVLLVTGCGNLADITSGRIGCAPSDIAISDESSGFNTTTWVATCHGKVYFCSAVSSARATDVACTEQRE